MLVANAMLLLASMTTVEAPQFYFFSSENCPACKQVQPVVAQLGEQGVPIVYVDANEKPNWTQQANVTALPTFIVVSKGQEVGRHAGVASFRDLSQLYFSAIRQSDAPDSLATPDRFAAAGRPEPPASEAGRMDASMAEQVRGQNSGLSRPGARLGDLLGSLTKPKGPESDDPNPAGEPIGNTAQGTLATSSAAANRPSQAPLDPVRDIDDMDRRTAPSVAAHEARPPNVERALAATVRLTIIDELGRSFGTGTIVDVHKHEALVLTCGHIFRDSDGKGRILCDSFSPGAARGIEGKLISYDIRRDIGLVSFHPNVSVQPVRVGGTAKRPSEHDAVYAIGCNRGEEPTVIQDKIISVNRYHGPPNLVVGGRPVDGRSGGGLFNRDGELIGVCNAADPELDEGLYAALANVHAELDAVGLGFIYRAAPSSAMASVLPGGPDQPALPTPPRGSRPDELGSPIPVQSSQYDAAGATQPTVLIANIRSPNDSSGQTKLIIERPSKDLIDQLMREANRQNHPNNGTGRPLSPR